MNPAVAAVEAFVEAWNRMDFAAVIASLDEHIEYHNMPLEPLHGRQAVADYLRAAWRFSECDWEIRNLAASGDTVLTERVDAFVINGCRVAVELMGVFVVRDGRIREWRDYFDLAGWQAQLQRAESARAAD